MSSTTPTMIVSGVPYLVTEVGDQAPVALADFAGDVTVRLNGPTGDHTVSGCGEPGDDHTVRLYEKDHEGTGKDVRVWTVTSGVDGPGFHGPGFVATG